MEKKIKSHRFLPLASFAIALLSLASCQKDAGVNTDLTSISQSEVSALQAIAVSQGSSAGDSIYVVGTCDRSHHTDSIAFSSLPSAVTDYLTANYAGYTLQKAFTDKDTTGAVTGYVVIINFNGKPVGLKFSATGAFVKVLEQREGQDLVGHGYHHGGNFDDRDGMKRDTLAISSLPATITNYFLINYPQDTLVRAFQSKDGSIVVLSVSGAAYATVFSASGAFVKRVDMPAHNGHPDSIAQSSLPAGVGTYLSATYPNYVFKHAFVLKSNGAVTGYVVLIDANATKYAIEFNASGTFVRAVTVR